MRRMTWITMSAAAAAMGLVIVTASGGPASAEPEAIGAGESMFDFSVCNRAPKEASVAISARLAPGSKDFVVAGWWRVASGSCRKIGSYPRGHFYMHATASGTNWGKGDLNLCVETPGPFKRINLPNYKCSGDQLRKFSHQDIRAARWEWTLRP